MKKEQYNELQVSDSIFNIDYKRDQYGEIYMYMSNEDYNYICQESLDMLKTIIESETEVENGTILCLGYSL